MGPCSFLFNSTVDILCTFMCCFIFPSQESDTVGSCRSFCNNTFDILHTSVCCRFYPSQEWNLVGSCSSFSNNAVDILCTLVCFSIYPSQEQDPMGPHIPISNNTGSLPDLTVLHFPSPLTTPLDAEDGSGAGYGGSSSPSSLSPTSPHHMAMPPPASQQSPAQRRRHVQPVPSPLVLNNSNQMQVPLSPPVSEGQYILLDECVCVRRGMSALLYEPPDTWFCLCVCVSLCVCVCVCLSLPCAASLPLLSRVKKTNSGCVLGSCFSLCVRTCMVNMH